MMPVLLAATLQLALATPARAQEAALSAPTEDEGAPQIAEEGHDDVPDEEIVVSDQAVIKAREQVGLALRDLGYHKKRTRNGREVYANEAHWKPWVVVDDDGWMIVKRAPVSFSKPELRGIWNGPLGYLVCVVNLTACIHVGGLVVSKRKLAWQKHAVLEGVGSAMERYEEALVLRALSQRMGEEIPEALDALWTDGLALQGQAMLADWQTRRQALLEFWISRNDNDWGRQARQAVRDFIAYEVQESEHPFTRAELEAANARRGWGEPLVVEPEGR